VFPSKEAVRISRGAKIGAVAARAHVGLARDDVGPKSEHNGIKLFNSCPVRM